MPDRVEKQVRAWLETFVVGLNLCPFARPYVEPGSPSAHKLRIEVCRDAQWQELPRALLQELDTLQSRPEKEIATTLLVFPNALQSFEEYLDFLAEAEELLTMAGLEGLIQLASFHPDYVFEGEPPDAASHYSNRAPYPAIHLLREDMMERVLQDYPNPENIPVDNIKTLENIGSGELKARWQRLLSR